jgi:hypothetical protein
VEYSKYFELPGGDNECKVYYFNGKVIREYLPKYGKSSRQVIDVIGLDTLEKFGVVNTKVIFRNIDALILEHELLVAALPSSWSLGHLKDALDLTLKLSLNLNKFGFCLKDFLPENIVFDGTKPFFIDFSSITLSSTLHEIDWIKIESGGKNPIKYLLKQQLLPYFLIPIFLGYLNSQDIMRSFLQNNYCNSGARQPSIRDLELFKFKKRNFSTSLKIVSFLILFGKLQNLNINFQLIRWIVKSLEKNLRVPMSAYSNYYSDKGEDSNLNQKSKWNNKQKNVATVISKYAPCSLLDLGSNTGWFSELAAQNGANVIALDQDISSIHELYLKSKVMKMDITPLVISFEELVSEQELDTEFGIQVNGDSRKLPDDRFNSDIVLALGLIHHLCLGSGYSIDSIMKILALLTNKCLIIEFIYLNDEKILSNPDFFANLSNRRNNYDLKKVIDQGQKYFREYRILESFPNTRCLIMFFK